MQYRQLVKGAEPVSLLGFGCMRFKTNKNNIDKELAFSLMHKAYLCGVNYFDTAYIYNQGKSEVILGEFIAEYGIRDKVFIADKLPSYLILKSSHIESYFKTQLERLNTTYIDYYLMHTLDSFKTWKRLKDLGIIEFIKKKKETGEIRYIGFSFHGKCEEFIKILEDYPWDFTQIQFNYLDENNQAGLEGLKRANELSIGVCVMEPLRGGALADKAPEEVKKIFNEYKIKKPAAFWGLRYVMNYKEVSCVLSGMNEMEHVKENINVASLTSENSMTEDELNLIDNAKKIYEKLMKVPCTNCNYCMPCPYGVDIPLTFSDYNMKYFNPKSMITRALYLARSTGFHGERKSGGDSCVGCRKCLKLCPQNINIPVKLKEAHKNLKIPVIHSGAKIVAKFKK